MTHNPAQSQQAAQGTSPMVAFELMHGNQRPTPEQFARGFGMGPNWDERSIFNLFEDMDIQLGPSHATRDERYEMFLTQAARAASERGDDSGETRELVMEYAIDLFMHMLRLYRIMRPRDDNDSGSEPQSESD